MRGRKSRSRKSVTYDVYAGVYMGSLVASSAELRKLFSSRTRKRSRRSKRTKRLPRYTYKLSGEIPPIDYKINDSYSVSGYTSSESPKPKQPKANKLKTSKQKRK
ncbi:MAG: hypothetical protein QXP91_10610 [Candidatus Methanomethylicia archaeon]